MVSAISNVSPYASPNLAALASAVGTSSNAATVSTSTLNQEALLEAELAIYTQQLAEVSSGDSSNVPGALSTQQLQQKIAAIQQQIDQLNGGTYTPTSSKSSAGNFINIFA